MFFPLSLGKFRTQSTITMGARGDSYYEYLLKQWIQSGKTSEALKADYLESVEGVRRSEGTQHGQAAEYAVAYPEAEIYTNHMI